MKSVFFNESGYFDDSLSRINPCKRISIASFGESTIIHAEIDISASVLSFQHSEIERFLVSCAYENNLLPSAYSPYAHSYTMYFTTREHFDEQRRICECYFFDTSALPREVKNAPIITSDIFLPLVFFTLEPDLTHFVLCIESHLYYYNRDGLQERRTLSSEAYHGLDSHLSYFEATYNAQVMYVYSFDKQDSNTTRYIGELSTHTHKLCEDELKAFLGLTYERLYYDNVAQNTESFLPNIAPRKSAYSRFLPAIACACVVFMLLIPIGINTYSQYLQDKISEVNAQNESLFIKGGYLPDSSDTIAESSLQDMERDIEVLENSNAVFIAHMQNIVSWQDSYEERHVFMSDIFDEFKNPAISLENITFSFTPNVFIASLEVSAQSQIHLSALLATLNAKSRKATMYSSSPKDSQDSHFYSHILVIHNVI